MRVIFEEQVLDMSVSSEDPNYPLENLNDPFSYNPWKAENNNVTSVTLEFTIPSGVSGIGIVNIVAESVTLSIFAPGSLSWRNVNWRNVNWRDSGESVKYSFDIRKGINRNDIYITTENMDGAANAVIQLSKSPSNLDTLSIGVLRCGRDIFLGNIQYPIRESFVDIATEVKLSGGGRYYDLHHIVREFDFTFSQCTKDFWNISGYEFSKLGRKPMMMLLQDGHNEYVVYGHFVSTYGGKHTFLNNVDVSVTVQEEI